MSRILVVDNDACARSALGLLLEFEGHHVTVVETGTAALDAIRNVMVDLVVLDIVLPDMHGHDVIRSIRSGAPTLPIVAVSRFAYRDATRPGEDVLGGAVALGARASLRKPFRPTDLLKAIWASLRSTGSEVDIAVRCLANAKRIVARQHELIVELKAAGCSTTEAERTLQNFLATLELISQRRRRLLQGN